MAVYLVAESGAPWKGRLAPNVALPRATRLVAHPTWAEALTAVAGPNYSGAEVIAGEAGGTMPAKSHTAGAAVRLTMDLVVTFDDGANGLVKAGEVIYRPAAVTLGLIS